MRLVYQYVSFPVSNLSAMRFVYRYVSSPVSDLSAMRFVYQYVSFPVSDLSAMRFVYRYVQADPGRGRHRSLRPSGACSRARPLTSRASCSRCVRCTHWEWSSTPSMRVP